MSEHLAMADHEHMLLEIPPKYAISQVVRYIKERARFMWRASSWNASAIPSGSTSGREHYRRF